MTSLPSSTNLRAKARPMPVEPPVIRMVRLVSFIEGPLLFCAPASQARRAQGIVAERRGLRSLTGAMTFEGSEKSQRPRTGREIGDGLAGLYATAKAGDPDGDA